MFCCSDGELSMLGRLSKKLHGGGRKQQDLQDNGAASTSRVSAAVEVEASSSLADERSIGAGLGTAAASPRADIKYAFEDGKYVYPNLFQEADELMLVALLMYTFTDLRALARQGKLADQSMLNLPITLEAALNTVEQNLQAIRAEEAGHEMALAALQSIQERYNTASPHSNHSNNENNTPWLNPFKLARTNHTKLEPATLTAFGDENSEKELVYGVGIDHFRKRITVAFRGSVTPSDFITDACIEFNRRDNPVTLPDQPGTIGIHHGFDEYLLKRRKAEACKYDEIIEHVKKLFEGRKETYKLYVTGHSLGGALACLFAFEVAAASSNLGIPTPVTCVSVASPRVGDDHFQTAFTSLEQAGHVRHLRIVHAQDPVTMMPKTSSRKTLAMLSPVMFVTLAVKDALFTSSETYRHCGVKLRLYNKRKPPLYDLSYKGVTTVQEEIADDEAQKKDGTGRFNLLAGFNRLSFSGMPGVSFHYGTTYSEQLSQCKNELSALSLNAVYAQTGK